MGRYVEGWNRSQSFLLPESVDDCVGQDNPVRVVDAFVDELDLAELGFGRATPADTGRPAYHPAMLLKLYLYGLRCMDPACGRGLLAENFDQVMRTYSGRPSSSISFSAATAIATSVARLPSVRDRNPSPITRLNLPMSASTRARKL